jgi:hypothetical protein
MVPQIIIQVVEQRHVVVAAMADQGIGNPDVGHGVALRDNDVGAIGQCLAGIGEHDVAIAADRRMIERLQQAYIRARGQQAVLEPLRDDDDADPPFAAKVDQGAGGADGRRTHIRIAIEVGDRLARLAGGRLVLAHQFAAHLLEHGAPRLGR